MSLKYLNLTGLARVITNLKNWVVSQIPTKTSEITNDSGFLTSHQSLDGKMTRGSYERIEGNSSNHKDLNDYITAGFYNVKTAYVDNCPTGIERDAALLVYPWNAGSYCTQEITETAASTHSRRWIRKLNSTTWSDWVAVAFHGDNLSAFNNDSGFITSSSLPTVNNATLTIQKNGTNVQTFTANASSNKTANITVPTKTSELTNDSGYLTAHQTVSNSAPTLAWGATATIGSVGGTNLTVTMPANPNTDTDTKVTQTVTNNSNTYYPLLFCNTAKATATETSGAKFYSGVAAHARYGYLWLRNLYDTDNLKGSTAGGTRTCGGVRFNTYNDVEAGRIWNEVLASGLRRTYIRTTNYITDGALSTTGSAVHNIFILNVTETGAKTQTIEGGWACNLIPAATNTYTLGTSSLAWKSVYADNYYGTGASFSYGLDTGCIEMNASQGRSDGGYIDFHYNQSTADFTSRIIENDSGQLDINGIKFRSDASYLGVSIEGSTVDLNDLYSTIKGATRIYYATTNGGTNNITNKPVGQAFTLYSHTVRRQSASDYVIEQLAYSNQTIYFRACVNGTWSAWKTLSFSDHTHSQYLTAHQSLANYVTLNGAQTITSQKIFTIQPAVMNTAYQIGTTPSSNLYTFMEFFDKNAVQTGWIGRVAYTNGYGNMTISCGDRFTNGAKAANGTGIGSWLEVGLTPAGGQYLNTNAGWWCSVWPAINNTVDLGTASLKWRNLFTHEVHCYNNNALMAKSGSYTFLLRNDGTHIWFLISEANGNEGTWSGLRPLYINCASGACTSTSKWTFDKSFGDGDPSVLIQSGTAYANGTWNYPLSALAPNMQAGSNLYMPIGRSHSTGNCAGWHFYYAGNNSNDNFLSVEFYAAGSPLSVYRDGRVFLSATPATSDNSTRVATTAFVKAQGYTTSAASKKLVLLAERSEAGTWTITCDTLKPIYFKFTASKNDSNAEFVVGIDGSSTCRLVNVNYGYSTNQFSYQVTSTSSGGQATWGIGVPTSSTITVSVWLRNTQFQRYFNIKAYQ